MCASGVPQILNHDLKFEINCLKREISHYKYEILEIKKEISQMKQNDNLGDLGKNLLSNLNHEINLTSKISFQK